MTTHTTRVTTERVGYVATCTCGGLERWAKGRHNAERMADEHVRKQRPEGTP